MPVTYKKTKSGRYSVELTKSFERRGFIYKPGTKITVTEAILDEMIAGEVVGNVFPAE